MLIGREKEAAVLLEAAEKEEAQFVAVYGRRRVGKTYLVRETFKGRFTFQHAGIYKGTRTQQLSAFFDALREAGLPEGFEEPKDWLGAFRLLKEIIRRSTQKKKILFLDEFSWMDTSKSDLIKALEYFWNSWASAQNDVLLIVCSSATSWMLSKVIHNK